MATVGKVTLDVGDHQSVCPYHKADIYFHYQFCIIANGNDPMHHGLFQIVDLWETSPTLSRMRPHFAEVTISSDHMESIQDVRGNSIYIYTISISIGRIKASRGISAETCGLDDIFPLDDLGSGPCTPFIIYISHIIAAFLLTKIYTF